MSSSQTMSSSSSSRQQTLLKIRPKELVYNPPFQGFITNTLKLTNTSEFMLAYKVKTTAPIRYCVRPNTGIIPPGDSIDIQILLNCTKDMPSISMKSKDKFQIQSTIVNEANTDTKTIWNVIPANLIMKQRLKAVFSLPSSSSSSSTTTTSLPNSSAIENINNITSSNDLSTISNLSTISHRDVDSDHESDNEKDKENEEVATKSSPIIPTQLKPLNNNTENEENSQLRKRNTSNSNEEDAMNDQVKFMKDKIEQLEKQIKNTNSTSNTRTNQTIPQPQQQHTFSQLQTFIVVLIIAALSFYFGRMLNF